MNGYIIALDQGTTSSRSIIFDSKGNIVSLAQYPFTQIYPKPGWVEHDPMVILESQLLAMSEAFEKSGLSPTDIAGIGITNQRETTIVWDKYTGRPVYNAIVWQCRRTAPICDQLMADGLGDYVKEKTGLLMPTSPARRSSGSWTTFRVQESAPSAATCCSAMWTRGSSGTSPAAARTCRTIPTARARCCLILTACAGMRSSASVWASR